MFSPYNMLLDLLDDDDSFVFPGRRGYYRHSPHVHFNVIKPRRRPSVTSVKKFEENNFQVMLNVKHFLPKEIEVKIVDNFVVIHGKHEEQADEHGFISREFTRRYQLPDDVVPDTVKSSLSQDGILTIQAPRKVPEPMKNERIVPIIIQKSAIQEQRAAEKEQMEQDIAVHKQSSEK